MKPLNFDFSAVSEIDWARLAAYIDGEGCIRVAGVKGKQTWSRRVLYLEVTVANTNPRLSQWLVATFGGSIVTYHKGHAKWKPCFTWYISSRHAAQILERCLPYFIIKPEQAYVALAFQATVRTVRKGQPRQRDQEELQQQYVFRDQLSELNGRGRQKIAGTMPDKIQ
jgi:hypothetical protein